jgi:hypothetical protein
METSGKVAKVALEEWWNGGAGGSGGQGGNGGGAIILSARGLLRVPSLMTVDVSCTPPTSGSAGSTAPSQGQTGGPTIGAPSTGRGFGQPGEKGDTLNLLVTTLEGGDGGRVCDGNLGGSGGNGLIGWVMVVLVVMVDMRLRYD